MLEEQLTRIDSDPSGSETLPEIPEHEANVQERKKIEINTFTVGFTVEKSDMLWCGHARRGSVDISLCYKLDHRYFRPSYAENRVT